MRGFLNSYPKVQSIENQNIYFEEAHEEIQTGIDQFIERMSNDIHKNHFSEWESHVMSSVNEKNRILKKKITYRSVKSIFSEHEVKNTCFPLKKTL